jgi:hypothetical protein
VLQAPMLDGLSFNVGPLAQDIGGLAVHPTPKSAIRQRLFKARPRDAVG